MVINGKTALFVNGKMTRVCGARFNRAVKRGLPILGMTGEVITPSKGLSWLDVAKLVRAGKSAQASSGTRSKRASVKLAA